MKKVINYIDFVIYSILLLGILAVGGCKVDAQDNRQTKESVASSATIDYEALYDAIAAVESDRGVTSKNVYQLRKVFVDDVSRIEGKPIDYMMVTTYPSYAEVAMRIYWEYYGAKYTSRTGLPITAEVLAKLHNVGYAGLFKNKAQADKYWAKVKKIYEKNLTNNK